MMTTIPGTHICRGTPGSESPEAVYCLGDTRVLDGRRIGVICSVKCPGGIILQTYDLMKSIRNEAITVISGFHSPMERECLNVLLRRTCGIAICYARSLPRRMPVEYRQGIDQGRMLLLSPFGEGQDRTTRSSSAERNRLVAALADVLLVPYASPGSMTEAVCREALARGRPVFTFDGEHGAPLRAVGAKAMPLSGVAVILQSVAGEGANRAVTVSAGEPGERQTCSRSYSVADIRRMHPRAYPKWSAEEEARLLRLRGEGKTRREIARELGRQPGAISSRLRKIQQRTTEWQAKTTPW
jgi:predicted Rossmann fold nucleotide-binding protein DprA/Smf involved in DNA uptake